MCDYVTNFILNRKELNNICVYNSPSFTSIKDIIKYIQSSSQCYNKQFIILHNNYEHKIFVTFNKSEKTKFNFNGLNFYLINLSDLYDIDILSYNGVYKVVSKINNLSSELIINLSSDEYYNEYRIKLNDEFISDYISIDKNFVTSPLIYKNPNKVVIYFYKNRKELKKFRLLNSVYSQDLISGVLTTYSI